MLSYLMSGKVSFFGVMFMLCGYALLLFVMMPLHEWAHAFAADRQGDPTPRLYGRLSLNPLRHLDWFGALMIVAVGIGYAKPVPVNPLNFRNPKRGMVLTALAGPLSNLLMALVSLTLFRLIVLACGNGLYAIGSMVYYTSDVVYYAYLILVQVLAGVNIGLAVFNLLPIPPLDGSRLWEPLLPAKWVYTLNRYEQYVRIGLLVLLFSGALDVPLSLLRQGVGGLFCLILGLPNLFA